MAKHERPLEVDSLQESLEALVKFLNETPKEILDMNIKKISETKFDGPTLEEYIEALRTKRYK